MAYAATVLSLMIASPSDVVVERNIAREIVAKWNIVHSAKEAVVLLPTGWDTHSSPNLSGRPQSLINERILKNADLLVGIFWTRLGSPTGGFQSGSVEEVERHLDAGKPAMLYFSEKLQQPSLIDAEQYEALQKFKKSCLPRGIVESFETEDDFREKFRDQLQLIMNEHSYLKKILDNGRSNVTANSIPATQDIARSGRALSLEAKQLLVEGAKDRNGMIVYRKSLSKEGVYANDKNLSGDASKPRELARWVEAVQNLVSTNLISEVNQSMYKVTAQGFKIADIIIGDGIQTNVLI